MGLALFAVALGSSLAVGVVLAPVAAADPAPVIQRPAGAVTADALPTVQIDGVVWTQQIVGDTVYAGGEFQNARPAGAAPGTSLTPRSNLLAYNIRTGNLITTFAPAMNAQVKAMAVSPDGKRLYVGGSFTTAAGVSRYRLAAFDTATGALVPGFAPPVNATVSSISASNTAVYVGGAFTKVGAVNRTRLAAFSPTNGALLAWAPTADRGVNAVLLTPDKSRLIVAGSFGTINGSPATGLGAINAATGALLPWAANSVVRNYGPSSAMLSLSTDGTSIFSAGYWYGGTGNFEGVLAADPNTGAIKWLADCHGDTYGATPMNGVVYAVSHWHHCSNIGGFPDSNPRKAWYHASAVTAQATGTVAHNDQGGFADFYGRPAPAMVNWFPDTSVGSYTGQTQAGWSTTSNGEYLLQGGEFPKVNGVGQQGLVRYAIGALAPKKQGPRVAGTATNPILVAVSNRSVRIKWQANWDRDDQVLTYDITRSGTTAPIYSTTMKSHFWNRPSMTYVDAGLITGQTYKYRITTRDPDGNRTQSEIVNITIPPHVNRYVTGVLADGAASYWRLSGAGPYVDHAGSADLTVNSGVTAIALGALKNDTDGAAGFNGATGAATTSWSVPGPNTFTAEAWFKTSSTSGGKILGFGNASSGLSGSYDRHLYLDGTGRLHFGVHNGTATTLRTTAALNDGRWHHVAAQLSPAGMALYLDGVRAGSNAAVTTGQPFLGYWRVGGDNLAAWPDRPTSNYLNGTIDEVAIYPTALSADKIRAHYVAGSTVEVVPNVAPVAEFTSSCTNGACTFASSASTDADGRIAGYAWSFGDSSKSAAAAPSHQYAASDSYPVRLTVTDDDGASTSITKTVVVTLGAAASDSFDRTVAQWGAADQGGTWTLTGSTFSTNGSTGSIRLATAPLTASATLAAVSIRDVGVVVDVKLDSVATGAGTSTTLLTRKVGTSDYRMTLKQLPAGAIRLNLSRTVNGTATSLRDVNVSGLTYGAGEALRVRFTVSGAGTTALSGKVWKVGTGEPTTAQITATDTTASLQVAGAFGVHAYLSGSSTIVPVTISLDNLVLTAS